MFLNEIKQEAIRKRFGFRLTQMRTPYKYKNLHWELDGFIFGFGDLNEDDMLSIALELGADQVFIGWNEHHFGKWRQTELPMVKIVGQEITFPHFDQYTTV